jgi:hypothetical protein
MSGNSSVLRWMSFSGSVLSILMGSVYVIYGFTIIDFHPKDCDFFYCNDSWRALITFAPERFVDTFQPIIVGGLGAIFALPEGIRPSYPVFLAPPSSSVRGGLFHIIMGLFTNLGYLSWFGITVASYNMLLGTVFIFVVLVDGRNQRPKDMDEVNTVPAVPIAASVNDVIQKQVTVV